MIVAPSVRASLLALAVLSFAPVTPAQAADPAAKCQKTLAKSMSLCVKLRVKTEDKCYQGTGSACADADAKVAKLATKITGLVTKSCTDEAIVGAGFGGNLTTASLAARTIDLCAGEARALIARSYGGPHAAGLASTGNNNRKCLLSALKGASKQTSTAFKEKSKCVAAVQRGKTCDTDAVAAKIAAAEAKSVAKLAKVCTGGFNSLEGLVGSDPALFFTRASNQADCMLGNSYADTAPLDVTCGPGHATDAPTRGSWQQITLDNETYGTLCGDGSDFNFSVRMAPGGSPADKVALVMEGGGVCLGEGDCCPATGDLFESASDHPPTEVGLMNTDTGDNPFGDWTLVFVPYCTRDVFAGGGNANVLSETCTVHRYGGSNVRAALGYVRDMIWKELDESEAGSTGYNPENVTAILSGQSAGAFGTLYNYHWVLDDLQWRHSTAVPDAALALDAGGVVSVAGFGGFLIDDGDPPFDWNAKAMVSSYCFTGDCAVGPVTMEASSPRLDLSLGQQFLVVTNQVDDTQVSTTFFDTEADWINAARASYCDTRDLSGVHYFMPAVSTSVHVVSATNPQYTGSAPGFTLDGLSMADWIDAALADPFSVMDLTEEGTIVDDHPGVDPYPCVLR